MLVWLMLATGGIGHWTAPNLLSTLIVQFYFILRNFGFCSKNGPHKGMQLWNGLDRWSVPTENNRSHRHASVVFFSSELKIIRTLFHLVLFVVVSVNKCVRTLDTLWVRTWGLGFGCGCGCVFLFKDDRSAYAPIWLWREIQHKEKDGHTNT